MYAISARGSRSASVASVPNSVVSIVRIIFRGTSFLGADIATNDDIPTVRPVPRDVEASTDSEMLALAPRSPRSEGETPESREADVAT
jgi:hypothetical protein